MGQLQSYTSQPAVSHQPEATAQHETLIQTPATGQPAQSSQSSQSSQSEQPAQSNQLNQPVLEQPVLAQAQTQAQPSTEQLMSRMIELQAELIKLNDAIAASIESNSFKGVMLKEDILAEQAEQKGASCKFIADRTSIVHEDFDRMTTARALLRKRLDTVEGAQHRMLFVEKTHLVRTEHHYKPQVQMVEQVVCIDGTVDDNDVCTINIPLCSKLNKFIYDLRLQVDGAFGDDDLEMISFTCNGNEFDQYRRRIYDETTSTSPDDTKCIPLEFWLKTINKAMFMTHCQQSVITITKARNVRIKLIARIVTMDDMVAEIYRRNVGFTPISTHYECKMDCDKLGFSAYNTILALKYGVVSDRLNDIASIDGVPIKTLRHTQTVTQGRIMWFDLICPIPINKLCIEVRRSHPDVLVSLVFELGNFLLFSDCAHVVRYVRNVAAIPVCIEP